MEKVCLTCGYIGGSVRITKGSLLIEIVLWLFLLIPGLIYSLWRLTSRYEACPECRNPGMIPVDSPVARRFIEELRSRELEEIAEDAIHKMNQGRVANLPSSKTSTIDAKKMGMLIIATAIAFTVIWRIIRNSQPESASGSVVSVDPRDESIVSQARKEAGYAEAIRIKKWAKRDKKNKGTPIANLHGAGAEKVKRLGVVVKMDCNPKGYSGNKNSSDAIAQIDPYRWNMLDYDQKLSAINVIGGYCGKNTLMVTDGNQTHAVGMWGPERGGDVIFPE
jgi:hypothetical protein